MTIGIFFTFRAAEGSLIEGTEGALLVRRGQRGDTITEKGVQRGHCYTEGGTDRAISPKSGHRGVTITAEETLLQSRGHRADTITEKGAQKGNYYGEWALL